MRAVTNVYSFPSGKGKGERHMGQLSLSGMAAPYRRWYAPACPHALPTQWFEKARPEAAASWRSQRSALQTHANAASMWR